jgi:hypothetical protein
MLAKHIRLGISDIMIFAYLDSRKTIYFTCLYQKGGEVKKTTLIITIILVLLVSSGCSAKSEQELLQIALEQTLTAMVPESTNTPIITLAPIPTKTPELLWDIASSIDEMSGITSYFLKSQYVEPTQRMGMPYDGVIAIVTVACDKNGEWAYIWFSTSPNLVNTDIEDGYDRITTRVKWDDSIEDSVLFLQKWGEPSLWFVDDEKAIQNIQTHDTMLLELEWFGEGKVYFRFPLEGAAEGIRSLRSQCNN